MSYVFISQGLAVIRFFGNFPNFLQIILDFGYGDVV